VTSANPLGCPASCHKEATVKTYRERKEEEKKLKPRTAFLGCIYFIVIVTVAYFLSGFVMEQVDLYDLLGLNDMEVPLIKVPGEDIPEWALQLVLAVLVFFLVQPFAYVVVALLNPPKKDEEYQRPFQNPWNR
jgi:phage shock protein PspC (stress-responsive transcriptional regulator)